MAKKILITDVTLRDAHQSLIATRMTTEEMLPILEKMDKVGFYSLECWGGATFDACLRFLNEDPWDGLRTIREKCPNTKLQMLFRGQNMLGYRHYADDVLEYFVQKSVANGIDIIRIFDALNDIKNLQTAIKAAKKRLTPRLPFPIPPARYSLRNTMWITLSALRRPGRIPSVLRIWRPC